MSFPDSIEVLTRDHKTAAQIEDSIEFHEHPALLEMLRDAVFGGMEHGGGSGSKARLPISEGALDLYQLIDHQIAEVWAATFNRVPSADKPEALLTEWGSRADADDVFVVTRPEQHERDGRAYVIRVRAEYTAESLAARWVEQIQEFFDPPRRADINAACFVCGERWVHRNRDGEQVQNAALTFRRDRATGETIGAECLACGTQWLPSQFMYLAQQIAVSEADGSIDE